MQKKKPFIIIISLIIFSGCTATHLPYTDKRHNTYYNQIKEWQQRLKRDGWTENVIDDIIRQSRRICTYRLEIADYWDTPREFITRGFSGDCEDIAIFMMANLKRLQYPYPVRVIAVRVMLEDHALIKVKMPDGRWKVYETISGTGIIGRGGFYSPIVEFDENNIFFHPKKPI
jgi:hypothetical protein